MYNAGLQDAAKEYLAECLKKYQLSYELSLLQSEFLSVSDNKLSFFNSLLKAYKYAQSQEDREQLLTLIAEAALDLHLSMDSISELLENVLNVKDYRNYPIDEHGMSSIRTDAFAGRDPYYSYLVNMYKTLYTMDVTDDDRMHFLTETIRGQFVGTKTAFSVKKGDIIAMSSAMKEPVHTHVTVTNLENDPYNFRLEPHLIKYFQVRRNKKISIESNNDIFVSHFKKTVLPDKPKLVMPIFIDGLSFEFLKTNGFKELMPNTYAFFKNGYINHNCHANGEWTLPSLMSMCTGKYTTNHYVFHTYTPYQGEQLNKMIQEYFDEAGYMTGRICPNWRGTPSYGYFKSTDRFVYAPMLNRMFCEEVATEAIEHLTAFKDFYNYLWITMEDLHAVADGCSVGIQIDTAIEHYLTDTVTEDSEISVFRNYNPTKIEEYKASMKKVDCYLGLIFDYISKNYKPDEYIVALMSDHGQKFIEEEDFLFTQLRTNVPFMMAGRNVIHKNSKELMSNVDILPTLLHLCGLPCEGKQDGALIKDFGGPKRPYTISESIFSGQTYKLAMNDKDHLFIFETTGNTRDDGLIPIDDYSVKLLNRTTGEDEAEEFPEKVDMFCKAAFEHIKAWAYFM